MRYANMGMRCPIATIGPLIVGLENRDGNANVRFHQADTLKRIFQRLANRGVFINRCRMDCGSYSKEIITFYNARGVSEKSSM